MIVQIGHTWRPVETSSSECWVSHAFSSFQNDYEQRETVAVSKSAASELMTCGVFSYFVCVDYGVLDGVYLLVYANKLDLQMNHPLDVNEVGNGIRAQSADGPFPDWFDSG